MWTRTGTRQVAVAIRPSSPALAVCVDDVWPVVPYGATNGEECPQVITDSERPTECRYLHHWKVRITQFDEVGLSLGHVTRDHLTLEPILVQPTGEHADPSRWTTHVHPGDDLQDPDRSALPGGHLDSLTGQA